MHTRPVWAEISRRALLHNYRHLRALAPPGAGLIAMVKANAYGHGVLECAPLLATEGAQWLAVTCVEEGVAVRAVCPATRLLILSGVWRDEAEAVLDHALTPAVWEPFHLDPLEAAARARGLAAQSVPVHLEIDTGMARQGVRPQALSALLARFRPDSPLRLEGVFTHFHSAEVLDSGANPAQLAQFVSAVDTIAAHRLRPQLLHAGNSANLLAGSHTEPLVQLARRHAAQLLLRPGLSLYGYAPRFAAGPAQLQALAPPQPALSPLVPVLSWKTRIVSLRTLAPGETAGYNATFRATRPTRLALLPLGYADGLNRLLSNRGAVLVHGQRAPIAGRISMDQTTLDVTGIPAAGIGDEAVLLGEQGAARITADDHAALCNTIPYEILCDLHPRVFRILID